MRSETSVVATQYRLQEWAAQIKDCQNRPEGMKVSDWCEIHGISKSNYYYRLRQVRRACLETFPEEQLPGQIVPVDQGLLAKIPSVFLFQLTNPSCTISWMTSVGISNSTTPMEPGLDICLRDYKIRVTEATPPGLLSTVLRVIRDAE